MAGFQVTSPALQRVASGMRRTDIGEVVRVTAVQTAKKLQPTLTRAAQAAGGSAGLVADVMVHDGHLSGLNMRQRADRDDVIVGIDGHSRYADEAEDLEWGSPTENPTAWVRSTTSSRGRDTVAAWSNALTREMDRMVGR